MATVSKNFTLKSYTNNTWTNITDRPVNLQAIILANTTGAAISVSLRLGGSEVVILPTTSIEANSAYTLNLLGLTVMADQSLQLFASAAGVHATASEVF